MAADGKRKLRRSGRKAIPVDKRRKTISVRVSPETYNYFGKYKLKAGLEIDRLVKRAALERSDNSEPRSSSNEIYPSAAPIDHLENCSCETSEYINEEAASDIVTEYARGFLAMIVERGTGHLSQEQNDILSENFSLLVNNYLATFKKQSKAS